MTARDDTRSGGPARGSIARRIIRSKFLWTFAALVAVIVGRA